MPRNVSNAQILGGFVPHKILLNVTNFFKKYFYALDVINLIFGHQYDILGTKKGGDDHAEANLKKT